MSEPRWSMLLRRLEHRATPIIAVLLIGLVFFLGIRSERTGFVDEVLDPNLKRITHPVLNAFRGRPPRVTALNITLEAAAQDSLQAMQDEALTNGWFEAVDTAWVLGEAILDERSTAAFLQLQSGPIDRQLLPRWPLRIGLIPAGNAGEPSYFDLLPVNDAHPIHAALVRNALQHAGIPLLSNEIIELRINDRDQGLHTLEGRLDSTQLAAWARGPGPVLRFSDEFHRQAQRRTPELVYPADGPLGAEWLSAPILMEGYPGQVAYSTAGVRAMEALEQFRAGRRRASEVFDARSFGELLALCDILGAQETIQWWNLLFLADSTSGKLIVLPQRILAGNPINTIIARSNDTSPAFPARSNTFVGRSLGDPAIYTTYMEALAAHNSVDSVDTLLARSEDRREELHRIIRSEYPDVEYDRTIVDHCRAVVERLLHPEEPALVYTRENARRQRILAVANVHDLPLVAEAYVTGLDTLFFSEPMVLAPRERNKPLAYTRITVNAAKAPTANTTLLIRLLGTSTTWYIKSRETSMFIATDEATTDR